MAALKVLHVVSVEKENYYLRNLSEFSDPADVEHSFVTFASPDCDFVRDMTARASTISGLGTMTKAGYPRAYRELGRLFKRLEPDVVHTHLFDPSVIGLTVAKRQGRKTVLTRHHSDAIHAIASAPKRKFYLALENYISRNADHIIAPSRTVRDFLVEKERVPVEKVTIIPYGQTTERFDVVTPEKVAAVQAELGMDGRRLALVCVSRLFHRKGHKFLFEAYAALKNEGLNATIYLVGDGDYRAQLEAATRVLGIADDVQFLGWRDDALIIIAAADAIVHPSLEDALSSAVIESLMLERPVVATDISGVRDILDDGKYGKIVAPEDSAAFRCGLSELIEDLGSARKKARDGRMYLLNYMDARRVSLAYTEIYRQVLNS